MGRCIGRQRCHTTLANLRKLQTNQPSEISQVSCIPPGEIKLAKSLTHLGWSSEIPTPPSPEIAKKTIQNPRFCQLRSLQVDHLPQFALEVRVMAIFIGKCRVCSWFFHGKPMMVSPMVQTSDRVVLSLHSASARREQSRQVPIVHSLGDTRPVTTRLCSNNGCVPMCSVLLC